MKTIVNDIKSQNFKPVYLLCGDEVYLKKQFRDKLKEGILNGDDTNMNYSYYEGKQLDVADMAAVSQTLPFFAERRLIVAENSGLFEKTSEQAVKLIEDMPESTFVVFVEEKVDKRNKLYKLVKEKGYVSEMTTPNSEDLIKWTYGLFKKDNLIVSRETIVYLLTKTGESMDNIRNEVEKLACFCDGRDTVTVSDVDQVCVTQISKHIFDMTNAIARKDKKQALNLYADLLALKEPPLNILALMARQFNQLLMVKEMTAEGRSRNDIANKLNLQSFVANKLSDQSRAFTKEILTDAINTCIEFEEAVKTGKMTDQLVVEMIIVKYS